MAQTNLKMFATSLATYARKQLKQNACGSLLIRMTGDGSFIGGIYSNANYLGDSKARQEVDLVKRGLRQAGLDVLQFGLSLDGFSWAMLVKVEDGRYQTEAGRTFQRELRKAFLDDIVNEAHQTLYGTPPDRQELQL
jgi:hypothetical protein